MSIQACRAQIDEARARITKLQGDNAQLEAFHSQISYDQGSCSEAISRQLRQAQKAAGIGNVRIAAVLSKKLQSQISSGSGPAIADGFSKALKSVSAAIATNDDEIADLKAKISSLEAQIEQERARQEAERLEQERAEAERAAQAAAEQQA